MGSFFRLYVEILFRSAWWLFFNALILISALGLGVLVALTQRELVLENLAPLFEQMEVFADSLKEASPSGKFFAIAWQHVLSSTYILLMGTLLGVFPFLFLVSSGLLGGIMLTLTVSEAATPVGVVLFSLQLGIELLATLLLATWGMKLGWHTLRMTVSGGRLFLESEPSQELQTIIQARRADWKATFNECGFVWLLVIAFFLVSAGIDVFM